MAEKAAFSFMLSIMYCTIPACFRDVGLKIHELYLFFS